MPALLLAGAGTLLTRARSFHSVALITTMVAWLCAFLSKSLWPTAMAVAPELFILWVVWPATLVGIVAIGRRAESARAGSVIEGARVRALWVATAVVAALVAWGARAQRYPTLAKPEIVCAIGFAAVAVLARMAFLDVRNMAAAARLRPAAARGISRTVLDFGVGDEVVEHSTLPPAGYRESGLHVLEVRGSRRRALTTLGIAITFDVLALALAAWTLAPLVTVSDPQVPRLFARPCIPAPVQEWAR